MCRRKKKKERKVLTVMIGGLAYGKDGEMLDEYRKTKKTTIKSRDISLGPFCNHDVT